MMKCMFAALAAAGMLALPTSLEADDWTWNQASPDEARVSLFSGKMTPEGVKRGMGPSEGNRYHVEYVWWGFDKGSHQIQAAFWLADDDGGWNDGTNFFRDFLGWGLDDTDQNSATRGPTISTVIGDIETQAFRVDNAVDIAEDDPRQCLGFGSAWGLRETQDSKSYQKLLNFYACWKDGRPMSEETFRRILSGLAIEGEFEALVEAN